MLPNSTVLLLLSVFHDSFSLEYQYRTFKQATASYKILHYSPFITTSSLTWCCVTSHLKASFNSLPICLYFFFTKICFLHNTVSLNVSHSFYRYVTHQIEVKVFRPWGLILVTLWFSTTPSIEKWALCCIWVFDFQICMLWDIVFEPFMKVTNKMQLYRFIYYS
jgi:hypothetical protein